MYILHMKEKILNLSKEGKSYNEISKILNCSKGTISYHLGKGQKEKTMKRKQKRRENILVTKYEAFKYRKPKYVNEMVRKFNKNDRGNYNNDIKQTFVLEDVINKFGIDTICYLSGEKINLYENNYSFDHIFPSSKGGDNSLENLGITHEVINRMKSDLTVDELLEWCQKILRHNNYIVVKK